MWAGGSAWDSGSRGTRDSTPTTASPPCAGPDHGLACLHDPASCPNTAATARPARAGPRPRFRDSPPPRRGHWPGRSGSRRGGTTLGLADTGCTHPLEDLDEAEWLLERVEVELEGGHPLREGGRDNQESRAEEEEGDRRERAAQPPGRAGGAGFGRRGGAGQGGDGG